MLTHLDLFSGIGGFALALKGVVTTKAFCEIDPTAQEVLKTHIDRGVFPHAHIVDDVRRLTSYKCDVITAGWPCIGFSVCGSRKGFDNEQSALFSHVLRVVKASNPKVVILENTPDVQRELGYITRCFVALGYVVRSHVFTAEEVGLPHVRARWFAVVYRPSSMDTLRKLSGVSLPPMKAQPCVKSTEQHDQARRFKLLRNAVVPRTAAHAVSSLCAAVVFGKPIPPPASRLDLKLVVRQRKTCFARRVWPTLHGCWRLGSRVLTERTSYDIQTAVKYAAHLPAGGETSLRWLEWLMNFPPGWTRLSR